MPSALREIQVKSVPPSPNRQRPKRAPWLKGKEIPFFAVAVPGTACLLVDGLGFEGISWLFYLSPFLAFLVVRLQNRQKSLTFRPLVEVRTTLRLYALLAFSIFVSMMPLMVLLSMLTTSRIVEGLPLGFGFAMLYGSPVYLAWVVTELINSTESP